MIIFPLLSCSTIRAGFWTSDFLTPAGFALLQLPSPASRSTVLDRQSRLRCNFRKLTERTRPGLLRSHLPVEPKPKFHGWDEKNSNHHPRNSSRCFSSAPALSRPVTRCPSEELFFSSFSLWTRADRSARASKSGYRLAEHIFQKMVQAAYGYCSKPHWPLGVPVPRRGSVENAVNRIRNFDPPRSFAANRCVS